MCVVIHHTGEEDIQTNFNDIKNLTIVYGYHTNLTLIVQLRLQCQMTSRISIEIEREGENN